MPDFNPQLLSLLRCPLSQQAMVQLTAGPIDEQWLIIREDGQVAYPIEHGLPVMLADRAVKLEG
jgi:uncharacterized protein YbaR (Trm112 family)